MEYFEADLFLSSVKEIILFVHVIIINMIINQP